MTILKPNLILDSQSVMKIQNYAVLSFATNRVTLVVKYLGWVDYDFGHSTGYLVLLG